MGVIVDTTVKVRWGYSLAALDQVASYDEALAQAALLINAVLTYADVPLVLVESLVPDDDQGWILGELTFRAIHRIALTT